MSHTKFEYNEIVSIYDSMNQITGDSSDPTSIAGLLHKVNEEYHEVVNGSAGEDALAIYGALGATLLNSWENTASTFPNFVNNFSAWSTLVAQAAGDYSKFEEAVQGIRSANPLGWNTGGITESYVASSPYANSYTHDELDQMSALAAFYDPVGANYTDTGMVSYANKSIGWNIFTDLLSVASIIASGCSIFKALKPAAQAANTVANAGQTVAKETVGEVAEQVGKKSIDDLVGQMAGKTTKEQAAFVQGLIDDGTITNAEDFLKFFGGKESVAKQVFSGANGGGGGKIVRDILKGFSSSGAASQTVATTSAAAVASNTGATTNNIFTAAKNSISNMTDEAIIKVMGLSDEVVASIAVDGGTVKQYALEVVKSNFAWASKFAEGASSLAGKIGTSSVVPNVIGVSANAGQWIAKDYNMSEAANIMANVQTSGLTNDLDAIYGNGE